MNITILAIKKGKFGRAKKSRFMSTPNQEEAKQFLHRCKADGFEVKIKVDGVETNSL